MLKSIVNINKSKIGLLIFITLSLSACGGGGSSSKVKVLNGVFKDSNVTGLAYVSGKQKGITDKNGGFKYEEGNNVTFSVGLVSLGSAKGKAVMTPLDLVADGSLNSKEVINKARFLIMLDKDNNPGNGIEISSKVSKKAESWSPINFASTTYPSQAVYEYLVDASVADTVSHSIPDSETAKKHLRTTLLCANTGGYIGTYTGSDSGNIAFILDPVTGDVKGASYQTDSQVSTDVNSSSPLDYDTDLSFISAEASAKKYTGKFVSTEKMEGSWFDVSRPLRKGNFSASRLADSANTVYRYTASFTGSDKGIFAFNVDKRNKISGSVYSISEQKQISLSGKLTGQSFSASTASGIAINGLLNLQTQAISGVWSNVSALQTGTFSGGGCRLN